MTHCHQRHRLGSLIFDGPADGLVGFALLDWECFVFFASSTKPAKFSGVFHFFFHSL